MKSKFLLLVMLLPFLSLAQEGFTSKTYKISLKDNSWQFRDLLKDSVVLLEVGPVGFTLKTSNEDVKLGNFFYDVQSISDSTSTKIFQTVPIRMNAKLFESQTFISVSCGQVDSFYLQIDNVNILTFYSSRNWRCTNHNPIHMSITFPTATTGKPDCVWKQEN